MPSSCFRAICKQMAKLHEAIIDILPQEQVKVDNQLFNNVFDHLNLFDFIYNIVCFEVHVCLSQSVFVMQYNVFLKTNFLVNFLLINTFSWICCKPLHQVLLPVFK